MAVEQEKRGFVYKKRSKDSMKERANMRGGNYDSIFKPKFKQWKPKEGKNRIRILPPTWDKANHYGLDIYVNYSIGPDKQSYLSLSKHGKGDDPLAEARRDALSEGEKDYAKQLTPNQRILYWIVDRNDEEEGPLLWAAPFTFDKALANICIDEDTREVVDPVDPEEGFDVRFYREGTGLNTTYDASRMKLLPTTPVHEDEDLQAEWLAFAAENPLPDVLNFYDYDHIKANFDGQAGRDDDDDTDKAARRRTKPKETNGEDTDRPLRRSQAKVEDGAEDDKPARSRSKVKEEDDEAEKPTRSARKVVDDDDDDVPAKPTRARSRTAIKDADDSDDSDASDDDDSEDSEEVRPTKSLRGKSDGDEETPTRGGKLRERLAARRKSRTTEEDDD